MPSGNIPVGTSTLVPVTSAGGLCRTDTAVSDSDRGLFCYAALALKLGLSDSKILDHLFLSAYSRYPGEAEKQATAESLKTSRA